MIEASIQVEGLDDIQQLFKRLPLETDREMTRTMGQATELVRGEIAEYPPATEANMPGQARWYERGYGTRTATGRGYPTSERLGQSWITRVSSAMSSWTGLVGTNVSYAQFVQGQKQASFHATRGWKRADQILEKKRAAIRRLFQGALSRLVQRLTR